MTLSQQGWKPLCIGHRGAAHDAPENTIPSFVKALEVGAETVELDVHRTRDGVLVCMHDGTVDRTTDGTGKVADFDLDGLKQLDAGSWMGEEFAGTRVPTLREALDCICPRAACAMEIKAKGIEDDVVRVVREADAWDRVLPISFHDEVLRKLHGLAPELPTGLIVGGEAADDRREQALELIRRCRRADASLLSACFPLVTPELIAECRLRGVCLWVWTLDAEPPMRAMMNAGIGGITSNRPDMLRRVIDAEATPAAERR
jgi:glycerophosphoryl diester phosphodiesterase